jgi:isopentenyldiphosphate isomerase
LANNELLDYYDANLTYLGTKPRSDVHREGLWHRTFHCHVIYRDTNGNDFIILQKRGDNVEVCPNMLDVSAAGHYAAGETMRDGVRELQEELGLNAAFEDLIPLGKRVSVAQYGTLIDYQVADVFFYVCDKPLNEYEYQHEEIAGLVNLNIFAGIELLTHKSDDIACTAVGFSTATIRITKDDFIPTLDHYFLKILLLAKRCLDGEKELWI